MEAYKVKAHTNFISGDSVSISGVKTSFREIVECSVGTTSNLKNKLIIKKSLTQEPVIKIAVTYQRAG